MSFEITVEGGTSKRLLTAGKYCDSDIVVTATGGGVELPELTNQGTAADMAEGKQLIDGSGNIVTGTAKNIKGSYVKTVTPQYTTAAGGAIKLISMMDTIAVPTFFGVTGATGIVLQAQASEFGNATADDVAKGKTFTSAAGFKAVGTMEGGGGSTTEEWVNDGNTHIWITLNEGRTSPMLGVCPNGTVTVDWGDGTTPDVLTGTSTSTVKWTPNHEYANPGDYVITLTVDGSVGFTGSASSNHYSYLLRYSSNADSRNQVYQSAVQKIEMSSDVSSIGASAFYGCYSLASVVIPNSITSIGTYAFRNCYSLTSIVIPSKVKSISTYAFYGCSSLTSIVIPNSVTTISSNAFYGCSSLTSIVIPSDVSSIGTYAFRNCYSLTSIVIPSKVKSISTYAFYGCSSLTSIVIPNSVTTISSNAFYGCSGIRYFDFTKHTVVPTLANTNAFTSISADCEIRVPTALYDEWIADTNWADLASQIVAV